MITPEAITFMATHGRGLICLAMTGERLDELEIARWRRTTPRWAAKERGVGKPSSRAKLSHFSLPVRPSSKRRR